MAQVLHVPAPFPGQTSAEEGGPAQGVGTWARPGGLRAGRGVLGVGGEIGPCLGWGVAWNTALP